MGFIISRYTNLSFYELMQDLNIKPKVRDRKVIFGGPIARNSGYLLYEHEKDKPLASGLYLSDTMSISPSKDLLEVAAAGELPGRFELILGYSGWGPGQLESEVASGGWLHTPFFPEVVFDVAIDERWNYAYTHFGLTPFGFISVPGGAQA